VNNGDLGRGAAQSVLLFAAVIAVTLWQFRTTGSKVTYGGA
jgi:sn-glycerol 3-phosphate transport system permease protein